MSRGGHIPMRTCIACRRRAPRGGLERFVATGPREQRVVVHDRARHLPGRGAYTCAQRSCLEVAIERRAFERTIGAGGGLSPEIVVSEFLAENVSRGTDGD